MQTQGVYLSSLLIRNFVLIEESVIEFAPGLNVISGETGAGKSIVLEALSLISGVRASSEMIRTGADKLLIEGVYQCPSESHLSAMLEQMGLDQNDDEILVISRELFRNGRGIARVNGRVVTTQVLRQLSTILIDLHDQQEHYALFSQHQQLEYLDAFADSDIAPIKHELAKTFHALRAVESSIEQLSTCITRDEEAAELSNQLTEIRQAQLSAEKEVNLQLERSKLKNTEKLLQGVSSSIEILSGFHGQQLAVFDSLTKARAYLQDLAQLDDFFTPLAECIESCRWSIDSLLHDLNRYQNTSFLDPSRLDMIEAELSNIQKLKRKYGGEIEAVIAVGDKIEHELQQRADANQTLASLRAEQAALLLHYESLAAQLSQLRSGFATRLSGQISSTAAQLAMPDARLEILLTRQQGRTESGSDRIDFLFSANPGEPLRSLTKAASGGELSRLMLAIKSALASKIQWPVLVFDEIDVGIGGRALDTVAGCVARLSRECQIICVTHSAQLAVQAQRHFLVSKAIGTESAKTILHLLQGTDLTSEIARMLGGNADEEYTRKHAEALLTRSSSGSGQDIGDL